MAFTLSCPQKCNCRKFQEHSVHYSLIFSKSQIINVPTVYHLQKLVLKSTWEALKVIRVINGNLNVFSSLHIRGKCITLASSDELQVNFLVVLWHKAANWRFEEGHKTTPNIYVFHVRMHKNFQLSAVSKPTHLNEPYYFWKGKKLNFQPEYGMWILCNFLRDVHPHIGGCVPKHYIRDCTHSIIKYMWTVTSIKLL